MKFSLKTLIPISIFLFAGCAEVDFDQAEAKKPKFFGKMAVFWVDQSTDSSGSGGRFIYVPDPAKPLTFIRDESVEGAEIIVPGAFYTDGGSIPRQFQVFRGFSPWAYGPVYIVHDWLFAARRCAELPEATDEQKKTLELEFQDTVDIFLESLVALRRSRRIEQSDIAQRSISYVISGPPSRNLWNDGEECSRANLDAIELGKSINRLRSQKSGPRIAGDTAMVNQVEVQLVTEFSF
ncbi:MAG: DUF1353 domain-containing protein [Pseudomonadota bacterium]